MLFYLWELLRDTRYAQLVNVFRYVPLRGPAAAVLAFLLSVGLGPWLIRLLRRWRIGQSIRKIEGEGNPDLSVMHGSKAGTPTMGGLLILLAIFVPCALFGNLGNRQTQIVLFATLWLGLLGFLDDYLMIKYANAKGLSVRAKLVGQVLLGLIIGVYVYLCPLAPEFATRISFPFFKHLNPNLGWFYIPFAIIVLTGSSNAANLCDGLDGLMIGTSMTTFLAYGAVVYLVDHPFLSGYLDVIRVPESKELAVFIGAVIGSGLGFLWYNAPPADIFMGDTGSLALGGAVGTIALLVKQEILLFIVGGVFVVEALSVMIQVTSYKLFRKRVFRMTPIHHHFEMLGWPESKIVVRIWIISLIFALIGLVTFKLR